MGEGHSMEEVEVLSPGSGRARKSPHGLRFGMAGADSETQCCRESIPFALVQVVL